MRKGWVRFCGLVREVEAEEKGEFGVKTVVSVIVGVLIVGTLIGALWSPLAATDTTIQALTETDAGTTMLKVMWPIALVVVGVGLAAGVVMWVLRKGGLR